MGACYIIFCTLLCLKYVMILKRDHDFLHRASGENGIPVAQNCHNSHATLSHPIPQSHPSAPALRTLSHASNLDWRSISHMITYMIQCYSLKSSHPHLLPKVCSLYLMSKGVYVCLYVCVFNSMSTE